MTIPLTGSGSLFVREGHIGQWVQDELAKQGSLATANVAATGTAQQATGSLPTRQAQVQADAAAGTAIYDTVANLLTTVQSAENGQSGLVSYLQTLSQAQLISMAAIDTGFTGLTFPAALSILVSQMTGVATLNALQVAVGAQANVGTPTGNPSFVFSLKDGAGRNQQFVYPEVLTATITQDTNSNATAGQEPWLVYGYAAQTNKLLIDWLANKSGPLMDQQPYGSGASKSGNLVDPGQGLNQGGFGNLTVNGDFRTYTNANYPDNWVIRTGSAGTTILNGAGTVYLTGGGSVEMASDGATLLAIYQNFNTASSTGSGTGGSPYQFLNGNLSNAVYCLSVFYKLSAGSPAAGVLTFELTDNTNTTLVDDQGNSISTTVNVHNTTDTNWHQVTLTFGLKSTQNVILTGGIRVGIRQSTAVSNGTNVFFANCALCQMVQLYNGGPYVAGFRGSTNPQASATQPDTWTFAMANSLTGTNLTVTTFSGTTTVTVTTSANHNLQPGAIVNVAGITVASNSAPNGTFLVLTTPSATTFTYSTVGLGLTIGVYSSGGTVSLPINQQAQVASMMRVVWRLWDPANQLAPPQGSAYFSPGNGYYIPNTTGGSPTVADTLVV